MFVFCSSSSCMFFSAVVHVSQGRFLFDTHAVLFLMCPMNSGVLLSGNQKVSLSYQILFNQSTSILYLVKLRLDRI
ncbi:uncharacterized protein BDV14DRAFT_45522 [Aspergillus stella-maris]|uniref:uncharacterized protein n=1 Tax=Aspergillus stella-maris TaxID=1810926 RepID=UPI003CCD2CD8